MSADFESRVVLVTGGAHRVEDYPSADFENVLRVNLKSVFLGMKYELPLMKRGGGGAICNTASVAALTGPDARRGNGKCRTQRPDQRPRARLDGDANGGGEQRAE